MKSKDSSNSYRRPVLPGHLLQNFLCTGTSTVVVGMVVVVGVVVVSAGDVLCGLLLLGRHADLHS